MYEEEKEDLDKEDTLNTENSEAVREMLNKSAFLIGASARSSETHSLATPGMEEAYDQGTPETVMEPKSRRKQKRSKRFDMVNKTSFGTPSDPLFIKEDAAEAASGQNDFFSG